jgi:transposase-like protein
MMTLQALLAKEPDADIVREMPGFAAQRLMELEVEGKTGVALGERSPDLLTQRNGYRERNWETRVGTINLQIPKLRKGSCFPEFLEPRRMSRRSPPSSRTPRSKGSPRVWWMTSSRRWG